MNLLLRVEWKNGTKVGPRHVEQGFDDCDHDG